MKVSTLFKCALLLASGAIAARRRRFSETHGCGIAPPGKSFNALKMSV